MNENTNGLPRECPPKGTDFSLLPDRQLESYIRQLNNRLRKCLTYRTPAVIFWERPVALAV